MDEEAVPEPEASSDPGYHDDDELAAVLSAQLVRIIETGSLPQQRELAPAPAADPPAPPIPSRTGPPPREPQPAPTSAPVQPVEPPAATGPLRPPSHRADLAVTATGPTSAVAPEHKPEHRAERASARAAHRSEGQDATPSTSDPTTEPAPPSDVAPAAPAASVPARSVPERSLFAPPVPERSLFAPPVPERSLFAPPVPERSLFAPPVREPSLFAPPAPEPPAPAPPTTGSVPATTGPAQIDTGSLPVSRRALREAERARAAHAAERGPDAGAADEPPHSEPVRVPTGAHHRHARTRSVPDAPPAGHAAPSVGTPSDPVDHRTGTERMAPAEDVAAWTAEPPSPPSGMPLEQPSVLPDADPGTHAAPLRRRRSFRAPADHELDDRQSSAEPAVLPASEPHRHGQPPTDVITPPITGSDSWARALRIIGAPAVEEGLVEVPGGPALPPLEATSWFEEPTPTTGTVVVSGSPTEPVPVADPDDPAEVDEVASDYQALAADTASVRVLPPLVEEAGRHVVPAISRESLDRDRLPDAVTEEPPTRVLRSGLLAPLATWAGAAGSPLAIVAGFGLGGGLSTVLGLVLGLLLALPAVIRLAAVGARTGRDAITTARAALGEVAGTVAGTVLLVARIGIAALGLLGVAEIATSYAGRTGLGGALPASGAAILAVLFSGLLSLGIGAWPGRVVGVLLGAAGAVALLVSAAMLAVLAGGAEAPPSLGEPVAAAVIGFGLVGLVVASGAAEVTRRPLAGTPWRLGVAGSVLGAVVGLAVVALGGFAAGSPASAGGATDAFVGGVVDATSVALVTPIAILLLLSSLALVATAARGAGTAAVALLDRGRSTGLGTAAAGLVAIAVALAALAGGLGASAALTRFGALLAVPLTAVLAALTTAPAVRRGGGWAPLVVLAGTVVLGWLLVDSLLVPGERSPVLDLVGMPDGSPWRTVPAVGLLVAALGGSVAGVLARGRQRNPADEDRTERLPAVQTATPE